MPPRSRKRRRSRLRCHARDSDSDSDRVPSGHSCSDRDEQHNGTPTVIQEEQSALQSGKFRPHCDYIKCLEEWVQYAEHVSFDYRVDLYTYIFKGHAILAAHQRVLYKHPARYLWFLMNLPASDDASDAAQQALVRSANARVHEMLDAHALLEQLIMNSHGGEPGQCEAKTGALGWSMATQLWHVMCILRFHVALVQQLLVIFEQDARATAQLKHTRLVPRDQSIAELCGASYSGAINATLPRAMCPPELLHSAMTMAPELVSMCCTLYPYLPIGLYSQFQVYEQLSFLSQRLYDVNVGHPALALFMRALQLRVCELLHHPYVAPIAWGNALLPCDVTPSQPLDMVPPERYRLAHRFGGVSPLERPMTVDLSAVTDKKKKATTPYEYKPDKAKDTEPVSPSRAFVDEVLGLIAPIYRQLVLVRNITRPPMCLLDESGLEPPTLAERRQRQLDQWVLQCATQVLNRKRVRINHSMLLKVFEGMLDYQRSRIVDLSYRDDICVHIRRMCLACNLPERYAHVPANLFARTYNSELLENAFLPRLVFQSRNEQWRQLELHELEQAPYIPMSARSYVQMCVMRTLGYVRGEDESWLARYALFHYQLEQLSDRMHLDNSPFVLVLGTRCYVRRAEQFLACDSVREAMLMWLVFVAIDHPVEHRRDFVKCVSTTGWVALVKQLIDNALKSSGSASQVVVDKPRAERAPLSEFEIDMRGDNSESSDSDDEESDSSAQEICGSDESDCEENLVEQYMQCDDLL